MELCLEVAIKWTLLPSPSSFLPSLFLPFPSFSFAVIPTDPWHSALLQTSPRVPSALATPPHPSSEARPVPQCCLSHSLSVYLTPFLAVTLTRSLSHCSQSLVPHSVSLSLNLSLSLVAVPLSLVVSLSRYVSHSFSLARCIILSLPLTCLFRSLLTRSTQSSRSCAHCQCGERNHCDHATLCAPTYIW